jgi:hypothetical protein
MEAPPRLVSPPRCRAQSSSRGDRLRPSSSWRVMMGTCATWPCGPSMMVAVYRRCAGRQWRCRARCGGEQRVGTYPEQHAVCSDVLKKPMADTSLPQAAALRERSVSAGRPPPAAQLLLCAALPCKAGTPNQPSHQTLPLVAASSSGPLPGPLDAAPDAATAAAAAAAAVAVSILPGHRYGHERAFQFRGNHRLTHSVSTPPCTGPRGSAQPHLPANAALEQ